MKCKSFIFSFLVMSCVLCFADSPITSTDFWTAYKHEKIIEKAQNAGGVLTTELADFLISKKGKIDVKMAVINCLSWDFNGKKNAQIYLNRLLEKGIYKTSQEFRDKGKAGHLLCMAYLKAMDNYFEVFEAYEWAELALAKNQKSYTFNIINAIIHAQILFDSDWCLVFMATHSVRINKSLKRDMNEEAIKIIFDYMDLYKDYCE